MRNTVRGFFAKHGILLLVIAGLVYVIYQMNKKDEVDLFQYPTDGMVTPGQSYGAPTPEGNVTFCFQLDGRKDGHLPHLLGENLPNTYYNGDGGYNYSMPKTATGDEDFGVMPDGTIFAKESWLISAGMTSTVYLKGGPTGWAPQEMVKRGDSFFYGPSGSDSSTASQ